MTEEPHRSNNATDHGPTGELAIVGIGNELVTDDGVGPRLVAAMDSLPEMPPPGVRLVNAGTTGFLALEAMSGCERAIVVDAIETGADPGTVHQYRCREGGFEGPIPDMTMHDVSFTEALCFARDVYDLPDDVLILGVEPGSLRTGFGLSEPVELAIPKLIEMIVATDPRLDPVHLEGAGEETLEREVMDA